MESRRVVRVERRFCPHCEQSISIKTYRVHKRRFFDGTTKQWIKESSSSTAPVYTDQSKATMSPSPAAIESPTRVLHRDEYSESFPPEMPDEPLEAKDSVDEAEEEGDVTYTEHLGDDEEVWSGDKEDIMDHVSSDHEESLPSLVNENKGSSQSIQKVLCDWVVKFLVHLQIVFHIPDISMEALLKFLCAFLTLLGRYAPLCTEISTLFPPSIHKLKTYIGIQDLTKLKKYVVCCKCHQTYNFKDCYEGIGASLRTKVCTFQKFPHHSHLRMRMQCGTPLLKTVELSCGRKVQYPFLMYCYIGLKCSLESLLKNQHFIDLSEDWRFRDCSGQMSDVYDGKIWSEYQQYGGKPFLADPYTYGIMMNIDWFRPYKHLKNYSIGAIYVVFLNLPRHVRFKRENILLVGLLPGPSEPTHDINSYLKPLVAELGALWEGVNMNVCQSGSNQVLVRCALLCVSCDIPAGRKACGFQSHSGKRGCSRCTKVFGGTFGNIDYSGFDHSKWQTRSVAHHRDVIKKLRKCKTVSEQMQLESRNGCHDSILLDLPYFESWRMLVVDPMHTLFLGTSKTVLKSIWMDKGIITNHDFEVIQKRIDACTVPPDIGRIPYKILSGFSSFTADQFKNWVVYYSVLSLRDILSGEHLECWRHFVLACRILTQYQLTDEQISLADTHLLEFCKEMERLYTGDVITPNMHLQCHLKECILDYGPLHGFWCFSFERYNGLLGDLPNNNRSIEVQVMKRFIRDNAFLSCPPPEMYSEEFKRLFPHQKAVGSLLDSGNAYKCTLLITPHAETVFAGSVISSSMDIIFPVASSKHSFSKCQLSSLKQLYSRLFSVSETVIDIPDIHRRYSTLSVNKRQLGSYTSRSTSSSVVLALWNPRIFGFSCTSNSMSVSNNEERPVRINYFARHCITIDGTAHSLTVASVSWYKRHMFKDFYGEPITIWECDIFEVGGCHSIIPVQFIIKRTISLTDVFQPTNSHALFICPCVEF